MSFENITSFMIVCGIDFNKEIKHSLPVSFSVHSRALVILMLDLGFEKL